MKRNWFYYFEGERAIGPLEQTDVIERILAKKLSPYQLMIRDGEEEWRPALAFDEFRSYLLNIPTTREPSQSWVVLKRQDAGGHLAVESLGPFTSDEVREQIQAGKVEYTDYVWKDGMSQWRRISSLKEFSPFEKSVPTPKPLVDVPPAPQIAKQVPREEVMKKVEVVQPKPLPKAEPPPPKEAVGPDLTKPVPPPEPPPTIPNPPRQGQAPVVVKGSPAGVERRRLPRTAHVQVRERPQENDVQLETRVSQQPVPVPAAIAQKRQLSPEEQQQALEKTVVVDPKLPKEAKLPRESRPSSSEKKPPERPVAKEKEREPREQKEPKESREPKEERTNAGVEEPDSVVSKVSSIYNARITLPRNWKQILIVLVLLGALYVKLFGGPDTIPLSQIPQLPSAEVPPPPPPPQDIPQMPRPPPPQQPQQQQQQYPDSSQADVDQQQEVIDPNAPGDEAIRRPLPSDPRPKKQKPKEATKLRAHMSVHGDGGVSLQIDTDAPANQIVTIEVFGAAGQVADRSHFYRRAKWQPGKPVSLGGELPPGYYRLHASVGNLDADEKFEIGTRAKGFFDKLRQTRKQSAYEFWNERKRLYQAAQALSKLVGGKHSGELDRLSRFNPSSFAFADLWAELKELCQLAKKSDPSVPKRLQNLQSRIASLSVWK